MKYATLAPIFLSEVAQYLNISDSMVRVTLLASLLAAASAASTAAAQNGGPQGAKRLDASIIPGAYIVEFEDGQDSDSFRLQAESDYETRIELDYELFRGISIQLHDVEDAEARAQQFASLPAVKRISPVRIIDRPDTIWHGVGHDQVSSRPPVSKRDGARSTFAKRQDNGTAERYAPHVMTQIDQLHAEGITGAGMRIAIIDSGLDYNHPSLGGCYGDGCLVVSGHDFVGDAYNGTYASVPVPDQDPMDCAGHGTHVAGIIAAQPNNDLGIVGAAPGVSLSAYRVFGCIGGSGTDVLIAAFNQAYDGGADIISASLGGASGWPGDPFSDALSRIVKKGVPCIVAAGNSGLSGLWDASAPATGKGVTSIASFDNTETPISLWQSYVTIDNGTRTNFTYDWGYPTWNNSTIRSVWVTGYDTNNTVDACEPLPEDTPDLSEFNVLIRRSTECDELVQAANVAAKGGRWLTIYNNMPGIQWFVVDEIKGIEGVIAIDEAEGVSWVRALEAGDEVLTQVIYWENAGEIIYSPENVLSPGAVSLFSCQGPTFELDVKPQFGGPGRGILSTLPLDLGAFGIASGTSMATPLVAGAYALIMEARGRLTPKEIENLLAANSNPQLFLEVEGSADGNEELVWGDWLTSVVQQGAGLIQVYDAVHASTLLEPSSLSFNDTKNRPDSLDFSISNNADQEIVYAISHVPTRTLYSLDKQGFQMPRPNNNTKSHAELEFSQSRVTIAPGSAATVSVVATPPEGVDEARFPLWSGYIAINGSDGSSLSLAYQGLSGSLYDATPLVGENATYVVNSTGTTWTPVPENTTFILPPYGSNPGNVNPYITSLPVFALDLQWGSPLIIADVVPVSKRAANGAAGSPSNGSIGQLPDFPLQFASRGVWLWPWLGNFESGDYAPAGCYKIVARVLRIQGDEANEGDWFSSEANSFCIEFSE
jgi:subtilisin family serine protease